MRFDAVERERHDKTKGIPISGTVFPLEHVDPAPCPDAEAVVVWELPARQVGCLPEVAMLVSSGAHWPRDASDVRIRFHIDPESDEPHIARHGVSEREAREVLERPIEDRPGREGARVALGQTVEGWYLRVIYVPDQGPDSVFVITAYDLGPKAKHALRRRRRRTP